MAIALGWWLLLLSPSSSLIFAFFLSALQINWKNKLISSHCNECRQQYNDVDWRYSQQQRRTWILNDIIIHFILFLLQKREDGDELCDEDRIKNVKTNLLFFPVQNTRRVPKIIYYLCENSNSTLEEWVWDQLNKKTKINSRFSFHRIHVKYNSLQRELHIKRGN